MQKLTDSEFRSVTRYMHDKALPTLCGALQKLLANYQEQLEAESLREASVSLAYGVRLERYTEANTCTTTLDLNIDPVAVSGVGNERGDGGEE